jgi:hypothetical protein
MSWAEFLALTMPDRICLRLALNETIDRHNREMEKPSGPSNDDED